MNNYPRPWLCGSGRHALGRVVRLGRHTKLELFRSSVYPERLDLGNVLCVVTGNVDDIRCDVCNSTRVWAIGGEALRDLLKSHDRMRGGGKQKTITGD